MPIWIDAEFGTDPCDLLALAFAARSPVLELVGVSSVGREARTRARIAAKLLAGLDGPDPSSGTSSPASAGVCAGVRVPLDPAGEFRWLGHEPELWLEPTEEPGLLPLHAVDALRAELARAAPLAVVCLGPLTNLAVALVLEPEGVLGIEGVWWRAEPLAAPGIVSGKRSGECTDRESGGADRASFATRATRSYNRGADRIAGAIVAAAGLPLRLPAPASSARAEGGIEDFGLGGADLDALRANPVCSLLLDHVRLWDALSRGSPHLSVHVHEHSGHEDSGHEHDDHEDPADAGSGQPEVGSAATTRPRDPGALALISQGVWDGVRMLEQVEALALGTAAALPTDLDDSVREWARRMR